jgi:CRP/FNR family cyclic AMP-dependent transcriptional regulator
MRLLTPSDSSLQRSNFGRELAQHLCDGLPEITERYSLCPGEVANFRDRDKIAIILEGDLEVDCAGKPLYLLEAYDIIAETPIPSLVYIAKTPVTFGLLPCHIFFNHIAATQHGPQDWTNYLLNNQAFLRECYAESLPSEFTPKAGFLTIYPGDTIIQEGDEADCVYTLIKGKAAAYRNGIKVGDIQPNEIFGAMAVFTRQPRMASVIAIEECTLVAVQKDEFIDLLVVQPQVCLGLIEEMAEKINQLNAQIISLTREPEATV